MSETQVHVPRSILVSGASIAGPALAFWLDRYGFEVTVVERAAAVRSGGYPIDIRGTALGVVERMGVLADVQAAHIASRTLTFVGAKGETMGVVPIYAFQGSETADVELPRGTLTALLSGLTAGGRVRYRFDDSIEALHEESGCVDVRFASGARQRFDAVIGADGLHSRTRELVFGPETPFSHDLGQSFCLFSVPNDLGLSHGGLIYAEPGRAAGAYAVGEARDLFVFLIWAEAATPDARPTKAEQIERAANVFAGAGWQVPRLVNALRGADDLFFDTVSQIRMPAWSKGRVALVGDAAFAPSFRSGQGTSLALVGAYVLAGELAAHDDIGEAFASYERILRPFVEANQALALKGQGDLLLPRTQAQLDARNRMLAALAKGAVSEANASDHARAVHNALDLPDYERVLDRRGSHRSEAR